MATLQAPLLRPAAARFRGTRAPLAAPRCAPARARGRRRTFAAAGDAFTADELFKPAREVTSDDGVTIAVPRLVLRPGQERVPSPFCTFSACALPTAPRTGPRNLVNLQHAFVSDEDRIMLKSIAYGNPTSAGAEDCDTECNFQPQWCVRAAAPPVAPSADCSSPAQVCACGASRQAVLQAV